MLCRFAFAATLALVAQSSFGAAVSGLYDAELEVTAKDEMSRDGNLRRALSVVLGRVIRPDALDSKAGGAILGRAADYAEEYEYLPGKAGAGSDVLRVRFDVEALRKSLQQAGIGIWGVERPEVAVWLLVQDGSERRLVIAAESPEFERGLASAAERRKLPIVSPLWDLTDQANLTWADAETGNRDRIREASRRYDSDIALVGVLRRAGEHVWDASWHLGGLGAAADWQATALELDAALQSGVDGAYGRLVDLYAPATRERTVVELQVQGISSMSDAERCGDYLRGLPIVKGVDWVKAESSVATWRLTLAGRPETLRKLLGMSRALKPVAASEAIEATLLYRWAP